MRTSLTDLQRTLAAQPPRPDGLRAITATVRRQLDGIAAASIVLWDAGLDLFADSVSNGSFERDGECAKRIRRENGATRWIVEHGHPLVVSSLAKDPFRANRMLHDAGFEAYAGVPLMAAGDARGVLYAMSSEPRDFTSAELSFLRIVASLGARYLEETSGLTETVAAPETLTVLVADDDEHLRETIELIMTSSLAVEVLTASTGAQTVRLALEHEPDLLLIDLDLGRDDGYRVAEQLREAGLSRRSRIWFVTGHRDRVDGRRRDSVGADGFLVKPFRRQEMLRILDDLRPAGHSPAFGGP